MLHFMVACIRCRFAHGIVVATLAVSMASAAETELPSPTLQDLQIAGRVLTFQDQPTPSTITIALAYNPADPVSRAEAMTLSTLLGTGLTTGALVLRPLLIEQYRLDEAGRYDAIFATTGIDEQNLRSVIDRRRVPCLTRHLEQVSRGACIVGISSSPRVSIVISGATAASAGIRFATAFRMMVREL